jgi:hypothetical protein
VRSHAKVWTPNVGEFKGKQICQECYDQIRHELEKQIQEQIEDQPGPIIDDDARLKGMIGNILNKYEKGVKSSKYVEIGFALTDDRTMWNIVLLKSIGELIKASMYYDELLLRKLDGIQEQLANTQTKEK